MDSRVEFTEVGFRCGPYSSDQQTPRMEPFAVPLTFDSSPATLCVETVGTGCEDASPGISSDNSLSDIFQGSSPREAWSLEGLCRTWLDLQPLTL